MSLEEGREGREAALDLLEKRRAEYIEECRETARHLGRNGQVVTVDMIRSLHPIPEEFDGRVMGAVMRAPEFVKVGYTQTVIKASHGRPIAMFKLSEYAE